MFLSKLKAAGIHLALSAVVLSAIFAVIFLLWYPEPYFRIGGASDIIWVLIGVDLVLGPLLTFVVFRKAKKSLRFDLSVIVLIQLVALVYGTHAIHEERPYFAVFAVDRFNILAAKDVNFAAIPDERLARKPWIGPRMVVAQMPDDPAARQRLMQETLFEGKPDIERRPETWVAYEDAFEEVMLEAEPLTTLMERRPAAEQELRKLIAASGHEPGRLVFVPVIGKFSDFALIFVRDSGELVGAARVDPWLELP